MPASPSTRTTRGRPATASSSHRWKEAISWARPTNGGILKEIVDLSRERGDGSSALALRRELRRSADSLLQHLIKQPRTDAVKMRLGHLRLLLALP